MAIEVKAFDLGALEKAALPIQFQTGGDAVGKVADWATRWHGMRLGDVALVEIEAIDDLTRKAPLKAQSVVASGTSTPPRTSSSWEDEEDEDF